MATNLLVFGDETGTHGGARVLIVGGYLGSLRQWKLFDRAWGAALDEEISGSPFHSREFFQVRSWQSSRSPYQGWTPNRAAIFLDRLIDIIDEREIHPVGGCVYLPDWDAFDDDLRKYLTGAILRTTFEDFKFTREIIGDGAPVRPPYVAALAMMKWQAMQKAKSGTVVNFVLDEKANDEFRAKEMFAQGRAGDRRIGDLSFASDDDHPGLQAADLYCYLWQLHVSDRVPTALQRRALDWITTQRDPYLLDRDFAERHIHAIGNKQGNRARALIEREFRRLP